MVHGRVGVFQQGLGVIAILGVDGNTDAGAAAQDMSLYAHLFGGRCQDTFGHFTQGRHGQLVIP